MTIRFLDWEMTGLGSGQKDLCQYTTSNIYPCERREYEYQLVQDYYGELVRLGVKGFPGKIVGASYRIGGLGRRLGF